MPIRLQTLLLAMDNSRKNVRGFTLIEIIVAVGIFSLVMLLAAGAYLIMIGLNRQAQGIASGIDNISFTLETMTRGIRTGTGYTCPGGTNDCTIDASSGAAFSFTDVSGNIVSYTLNGSAIQEQVGATQSLLTDSSVSISSLKFYVTGTHSAAAGDLEQARLTIVISGSVRASANKQPQNFTVETGATLRGPDI